MKIKARHILVNQEFDEVLVIGDYKSGPAYRHIPFPAVTATTFDACL